MNAMSAIPDNMHDRNQAELAKLIAETSRTLEEVRKVNAETAKIKGETGLYRLVVITGTLGGIAAVLTAATGAGLTFWKIFGG